MLSINNWLFSNNLWIKILRDWNSALKLLKKFNTYFKNNIYALIVLSFKYSNIVSADFNLSSIVANMK